jgi:hypothetical protein
MALGPSTFSDIGGAVSDIFAGMSATTSASLKAQGLQIESQGEEISSQASLLKAQGDIAEAAEYGLAGTLATQNANYTAASTAISAAQQERETTMTIGSEKAAVGGAGLAESGSALDLLSSSAAQGTLAKNVLVTQGQMTEEGYEEQAASYATMTAAAKQSAATEEEISGEQTNIAGEEQNLASETLAAGQQSQTGDFLSAVLKGAAAVSSIFTGGATSEIGNTVADAVSDALQDAND